MLGPRDCCRDGPEGQQDDFCANVIGPVLVPQPARLPMTSGHVTIGTHSLLQNCILFEAMGGSSVLLKETLLPNNRDPTCLPGPGHLARGFPSCLLSYQCPWRGPWLKVHRLSHSDERNRVRICMAICADP